MTVAAEIKALARELGVPQGLLAEQARMSRASLSLKLNGRRDMTLPEVERLAAALGTTPQDLIARAERTDALAAPDDSSDGFAIQDKRSSVVLLEARRVDWDGGDAA
ncbi:helix-turn-helix transcriptional regulator [uncultured Actinomyces sp.]|uniref:helix-turn-helix domain-containing protein n=1 Tax=uncultured Actinomyces sp. TaxID=249061 RepID=UPI0028E69CE5|nr:helix-turn-helix transcriptional regulator [uncultured Actinomyces sp.]